MVLVKRILNRHNREILDEFQVEICQLLSVNPLAFVWVGVLEIQVILPLPNSWIQILLIYDVITQCSWECRSPEMWCCIAEWEVPSVLKDHVVKDECTKIFCNTRNHSANRTASQARTSRSPIHISLTQNCMKEIYVTDVQICHFHYYSLQLSICSKST